MFADLPYEIHLAIFHRLESIDDVHHLGRTCVATRCFLDEEKTYVDIMRSIIFHSPWHRFDVQLCRMLQLHNSIVEHYAQGGLPLPPAQMMNQVSENERLLESLLLRAVMEEDRWNFLTDAHIYDILARWQGLRVLRDLWNSRQLWHGDYLPAGCTTDPYLFISAYNQIIRRDAHDKGPGPLRRKETYDITKHYMTFNSDQNGRFHSALTSLWLTNEIRWTLTHFAYPTPTFQIPLHILDECKVQLSLQTHHPLLDTMDQYAVYAFLYHHLLPLHSRSLADQNSHALPLTFSSNFTTDPTHSGRLLQLFLTAGQTYLQPPDIIDLVIRNKLLTTHPSQTFLPPASTITHRYPSTSNPFPQNLTLNININNLLLPSTQIHLEIIQRATYTQSSNFPAASAIQNSPFETTRLFRMTDCLGEWFVQRIQAGFDAVARTDRRDIMESFYDDWKKKVRWQVWWWANGDEKVVALMERWRVG